VALAALGNSGRVVKGMFWEEGLLHPRVTQGTVPGGARDTLERMQSLPQPGAVGDDLGKSQHALCSCGGAEHGREGVTRMRRW
jgi:hypothetical protein